MRTDRELLELAAKAAGLLPLPDGKELDYTVDGGLAFCGGGEYIEWEPLTDDGDALRLLVLLGSKERAMCLSIGCGRTACEFNYVDHADDANAATRRAIVIAMAAIGESMP